MLYVQRVQEAALEALLRGTGSHHDVLLIEGVRQVGKTTLVDRLLSRLACRTLAVNLERDSLLRARIDETRDFAEFEELLRDELRFDPGEDGVLFIDEAQESLRLGAYVRFMKESWRSARVVLSGSTLSRIFREDVRYPVGRVRRLVVRPFTFSEFLVAGGEGPLAAELRAASGPVSPTRHDRLLERLDRYLLVGGLPDVVLRSVSGGDFARRQAEIVADYEQDFIRLFGEDVLSIARGCLRSVTNFVGGASKNSTVVPQITNRINDEVRRVFGRLEAWRLVLHSEQRGPSPEASHRYLPKRYLFDTGVLRHLREKAAPSIQVARTLNAAERRPLGGVVENQVAIELADRFGELAGWKRSSAGVEIDFVCRVDDRIVPVECKAVLAVKQTHTRGLIEYLHQYGEPLGVLISFAPLGVVQTSGQARILNVPLYLAERLPELIRAQGEG